MSRFDPNTIRGDFAPLARKVHGRRLAYLDSGASSLTPRPVLDAVRRYYDTSAANIHRGLHLLSAEATGAYEGAREAVAGFLGAASPGEIVFVRGTTEAINLVAQSFLRPRLEAGDEILISAMEHHANIVPWQLICEATGARLRVIEIDRTGALIMSSFEAQLGPRTKLVAVAHASNALGTVNPVEAIIARAHAQGVPVLLDGAQSAAHFPSIDVAALDVDFFAFSGHKMLAPKGIGVLYGKAGWLQEMPPWQGGGDMIRSVTFEQTLFADPPARFEAGTPNIAGAIGLGAAVDYLAALDRPAVAAHEAALLALATEQLEALGGVQIIGTAAQKIGLVSFVLDGVHPHDAGTILDTVGVAVRVGHHCAQPVMDFFDIPATVRASFGPYNTEQDVEQLIAGIGRVREIFGT